MTDAEKPPRPTAEWLRQHRAWVDSGGIAPHEVDIFDGQRLHAEIDALRREVAALRACWPAEGSGEVLVRCPTDEAGRPRHEIYYSPAQPTRYAWLVDPSFVPEPPRPAPAIAAALDAAAQAPRGKL